MLEEGCTSFGDATLEEKVANIRYYLEIEEYPVVRHNEVTGEIMELILDEDSCYIKEVKKF